MINENTKPNVANRLLTAMAVLALAALISAAAALNVHAADTPIREAHKINIEGKNYCLFVTHNVVLTKAEIDNMKKDIADNVEKEHADKTDEEKAQIVRTQLREKLSEEILKESGLYLKETNCKKSSHKEITIDKFKSTCKITLRGDETDTEPDAIDALIDAEDPQNGSPLIQSMNLYKESADGKNTRLTYKMTAAELIVCALASEEDAKQGEDICEAEKTKENKSSKKSSSSKVADTKEKEEMLPEMRTIPMADRSGDPLKATLEDGSPVTLEWIDPGSEPSDDKSFLDRIPGGIITLGALLLGLLLLILLLLKRRKADDSE